MGRPEVLAENRRSDMGGCVEQPSRASEGRYAGRMGGRTITERQRPMNIEEALNKLKVYLAKPKEEYRIVPKMQYHVQKVYSEDLMLTDRICDSQEEAE